jgi:hypothetical protein
VKFNDEDEIEKRFAQLVPQAAPPGLRERVLGSALKARGEAALTLGLRLAAAACVILILAALGVGPLAGNREAARLAALCDGRPEEGPAVPKAGELAEMAGLESAEAERLVRRLALASSAERAYRQKRLGEGLRGPKGWSAYEMSEDLN